MRGLCRIPGEACRLGQRVAGIVIGHYGALAPVEALAELVDVRR
jgi:sugar/nucleoside kinase (ribokinase family)